jgi:hypothetical protein
MTYRTPYAVDSCHGGFLGKFRSFSDALRVAQMWSEKWNTLTEVREKSGLVGQFSKGKLTPEFRHVGESMK